MRKRVNKFNFGFRILKLIIFLFPTSFAKVYAQSYFPIDLHHKWTYDIKTTGETMTIYVDSTSECKDNEGNTHSGYNVMTLETGKIDCIAKENNKVLLISSKKGNNEEKCSPPVALWDDDWLNTTSKARKFQAIPFACNQKYEPEEIERDVKVPFGTFDAMRVKITARAIINNKEVSSIYYVWYAKNIGLIKFASKDGTSILELRSFEKNAALPSLSAPVLISPANGARITDSKTTLKWQEVQDAAKYKLTIRDKENKEIFTKVVPVNSGAKFSGSNDIEFSLSELWDKLSEGKEYYWEVTVIDSQGNEVVTSLKNEFIKEEKISYSVLNLVSPNNGTTITDISGIKLTWQEYEDPEKKVDKYKVEITKPDDKILSATVDTTEYDLSTMWGDPNIFEDGKYYWKVKALDIQGNSLAESAIWYFVKAAYFPQPLVMEPAEGGEYIYPPKIMWAKISGNVDKYEIEIDSATGREKSKNGKLVLPYTFNEEETICGNFCISEFFISNIEINNNNVNPWGELDAGEYIVKIRAIGTDGKEGPYSEEIKFKKVIDGGGKSICYQSVPVPNPVNLTTDQEVTITYILKEDANVDISIYNRNGDLVANYENPVSGTLSAIAGQDGGKSGYNKALKWNLKNKFGQKIATGVYFVIINTRTSSGEQKVCKTVIGVVR